MLSMGMDGSRREEGVQSARPEGNARSFAQLCVVCTKLVTPDADSMENATLVQRNVQIAQEVTNVRAV
jgi:hypothetical protein